MSNSIIDERIRCLRGVSLFSRTPETVLDQIAAVLTPQVFQAGDVIFTKGDLGDSLYIIAEGEVRVYDGDLIFNHLGPGYVFGEMAALDPEPRSASVMATKPTRLFQLEQSHLYHVMARQIDVVREIINVLCGYLRERMEDKSRDFEYINQVAQITAAAQALENGTYVPTSLNGVASRSDALGHLARVFQTMAREVAAREQRLTQQVQSLRIEIDLRRQAQQVAEITGSDYFQQLLQRVQALRGELGVDEGDARR